PPGGVRPDALPGILPPNASRLGQRRSRRGDPRSPKVTPERFCVLQHGSRVDGLPEVDNGILTSVVIVVPEARRAKPPRLLYAALRGPLSAWLRAACAIHRGATDRRGGQPRAGRIRQRRAPRYLRWRAARRGGRPRAQHHSLSFAAS